MLSLLLFLSMGPATLAAPNLDGDGWNDFTNNFATDIAPLVALFGEQVTKQFLSESTGILDNIIFGMAPLGILTAVVSAIRVYGWPSMKSFIGRAQEAHGVAEAELCSSTSYDVCELWSEGGICRVFGRPKVLEFFYSPGRSDSRFYPVFSEDTTEAEIGEPAPCDLYRPVCFFGACQCQRTRRGSNASNGSGCEEKDPNWEEQGEKPPSANTTNNEAGSSLQFAPCPNLSLNIGIRETPRWGLIGIATLVSSIQLGFFAFAAVITFAKPDLYTEEEEPPVWAFVLATLGTVMLISGMILCAFLIERRSTERRFAEKTRPSTSGPRENTTVYWLQPGGQLIGDQQFNAFSYSKVKHSYTTSFKTDQNRHWLGLPYSMNLVLIIALFASVVGFLLQFVGLRSLHGTITLYQTAATLFAAMIRALLRQRRLDPDDNGLRTVGVYQGHELDWQVLDIFATHFSQSAARPLASGLEAPDGSSTPLVQKVCRWRICDERYTAPGEFVFERGNKNARRIASGTSPDDTDLEPRLYGFFKDVGNTATLGKSWKESLSSAFEAVNFARRYEMLVEGGPPNWVATIVLLRSRLAFITGDGMTGVQPRWDFPVRTVAHELRLAMQDLADYVLSGKVPLKEVNGPGNQKGRWQDVSAITWHTKVIMEYKKTGGRQADKVDQIISLFMILFEGEWKISKHTLEAILGLWACSLRDENNNSTNSDAPDEKVLIFHDELQRRRLLSTLNLWVPAGTLRRWESRAYDNKRKWTDGWEVENRKIFLRDDSSEDVDGGIALYNLHLVAMRAKSSKLHLLAQNIFTIFLSRLADIIQRIEISDEDLLAAWGLRDTDMPNSTRATPRPADEFRGLANPHINFIIKLFVQSGLGTEEEAVMCILPVLDQAGILPREEDIVRHILRWTQKLRRNKKFAMAENALKVALGNSSRQELIQAIGELYRKAYMAGQQSWALNGLRDMSHFGGVGGAAADPGATTTPELTANGWPMHRPFTPEEVAWFKRYRDLEMALRKGDEVDGSEDLESILATLLKRNDRVGILGLAARTDLTILGKEKLEKILGLATQHSCTELMEDVLEANAGIRQQALKTRSGLDGKLVEISEEIHHDLET